MKVIGIRADTVEQGEFTLQALHDAVEAGRLSVEDMALVTKDDKGKVHIRQTTDATPKRGAKRGALVGVLVGLAAPPLLGAAAVGAGVGALVGKFRDKGVDDSLMKEVGGLLETGHAVVFALGDDASIDALVVRVRELTDGKTETFTMNPDDEELLRGLAEEMPDHGEHGMTADF